MRVMVIVKASKDSEAGEMPSKELLTAMGNFNEELVKAGIMLDGAGLKPSSAGARVRFSGQLRSVVDGPFAETKELIAGYWLWRVNSLAEAIEWVKRCPNPMQECTDIELRPLAEAEDFGQEFTPELREQEAALMAASLGLNSPRFEDWPDKTLVGLNRSYTMESRIAITQQWEQFVTQVQSQIPSELNSTFYGVCWNTNSNCDFDYLTGFESSSNDQLSDHLPEFTTVKIAASRYAVFQHNAHVSALPNTFDLIWKKWVPDCGLNVSKAACFERYTSEFNPHTGMGGMEVWIPLN